MKVKELISILNKINAEFDVVVPAAGLGADDCYSIEQVCIRRNNGILALSRSDHEIFLDKRPNAVLIK